MSDTPQWALERIEEAKRTGATTLDLSRLVYGENNEEAVDLNHSLSPSRPLPDAVRTLTGLTSLNVAANELTEMPGWLGNLIGLTRLDKMERDAKQELGLE